MSEMVERVARAMVANPPEERQEATDDGWRIIRNYERTARAAIEAMWEPTEAMQRAIPPQDYTMQHYYGTGHHATFPTLGSGPMKAWRAMIAAALSEGKP